MCVKNVFREGSIISNVLTVQPILLKLAFRSFFKSIFFSINADVAISLKSFREKFVLKFVINISRNNILCNEQFN